MSVEGMWCFANGDASDKEVTGAGVLVLDTQRLYGGDGVIAHIGTYSVQNGEVSGLVESFPFIDFPEGSIDVFDDLVGPPRHTTFTVSPGIDGLLVGTMRRNGVDLPVALRKLRDLP